MKKLLIYILALLLTNTISNAQKYDTHELESKRTYVNNVAQATIAYLDSLEIKNDFLKEKIKKYEDPKEWRSSQVKKSKYAFNKYLTIASQKRLFKKQLALANTSKEQGLDGNIIKLNASEKTKLAINTTGSIGSKLYLSLGIAADASNNVAKLFGKGNTVTNFFVTPGIIWLTNQSVLTTKPKAPEEQIKFIANQKKYYDEYYRPYFNNLINSSKAADDSIANGKYIVGYDIQKALEPKIDKYNLRKSEKDNIKELENDINNQLFDIEIISNDNIRATKIGWISVTASYGKIKFDAFNDNWAFSEKVGDRNFEKWDVKIAYNYSYINYKLKKKYNLCKLIARDFYLNTSLSIAKKNVWEDLDAVELTINRYNKTQNDSILLFSEKKSLLDVTKTEFESYWEYQPALFAYLPLPFIKSDNAKLSIGLSGKISENRQPIYEPKLGVVFNVQDANKEEKSLVSFEFFVKIKDVFNTRSGLNKNNEEETIPKRTIIGINASVPFAKLIFFDKSDS